MRITGSKGRPFPLSVNVVGCDVPPCAVAKGSTAVMEAQFVGTHDNIQEITTAIRATTLGITVPYPLPEDVANVCENLLYGANCPIDQSEDATYQLNFYIDKSYPEIPVKVEVDLVDENKQSIACFTVDIKVTKGSSKKYLEAEEVDKIA
ncbi:NPC intracellular cholesterol transporter 2-like isoform X2 [Eurosta solidaginis]|uniref:NPC intracellular cholesterol transporter 2-like isoform X2 n=1 Tax=Eurosta solidaginis TaxID=178769 RepID=UPI00353142D6